MNFKERLDLAQKLLLEKRVPNVEHGNNLHALLRLFGVQIRPPHFSSFGFNLVVYGIAYTIPCVLLAWFATENHIGFVKIFWGLLPFSGMMGV